MSVRSKIRWGVLGAAWLATAAAAQSPPESEWTVVAGSDTLAVVVAATEDVALHRALAHLHSKGRVYARIDSLGAARQVFVSAGPRATVRRLELVGAASVDVLPDTWETQEGDLFDLELLQADLSRSAQRYFLAGFPEVELVPILEVDTSGVAVRVEVNEGARAVLAGVELVGGRSASRALATRLSGLDVGSPFQLFDTEALRRELEATGLFERIGEPSLVLDANRQLVVQVPVVEGPPGTFDLVLGYLPSANGSSGGLVGSGRLELRNPFGGGRSANVSINRTPGLVSAFDLALSDPFVAGLPVRLTGAFSGYARDSTFSRQRLRAETGLKISRGLELSLSASREGVSPGAYGAAVIDGEQRVVRSSALFFGAGLALQAVDAPLNPRRGILLRVSGEQGQRRRTPDPTVAAASSHAQRRLDLRVRGFLPTLARQTVVLGIEGQGLLASPNVDGSESTYDEGELLRMGGATSLRGYDEDAFLGNVVGRLLLEYRFLLGPQTFAFGFGDLGYIDRPALLGQPADQLTRSGYGAGVQVRTGIGLATVTYALNPDLPASRGKVHVGLSVGL